MCTQGKVTAHVVVTGVGPQQSAPNLHCGVGSFASETIPMQVSNTTSAVNECTHECRFKVSSLPVPGCVQ